MGGEGLSGSSVHQDGWADECLQRQGHLCAQNGISSNCGEHREQDPASRRGSLAVCNGMLRAARSRSGTEWPLFAPALRNIKH